MLTHRNLVAVKCQVEAGALIGENWRTLGIVPFFHIYGLVALMNFPLYFGGLCVTMPRFDLAQLLRHVQGHELTHLYLVPPIVLALAKHPLVDQFDLSSVKLVHSGGAPLEEALQQACPARLRCLVTHDRDEPSVPRYPARPRARPRRGRWPHPPQHGGEDRGPRERRRAARGRARRDLRARAERHEGLPKLARGHRRSVKELIKCKGMQVAAAELEGLLLTHPAVADAAVIPSPNEEAGEVPKAFVVLRTPLDPDALMEFIACCVAPHKKIRRVQILDAIPRSASGKVRRVLVEQERAAQRAG